MTNIADEGQVKKISKDYIREHEIHVLELKKLLELRSMRDFMWRLLEEAGVFHSIWEQSARIHYSAGKQDFGHFLMGQIQEANEEALFQMMRENKIKKEENENV